MKNKWLKIEKQGNDLVLTKCDDRAKGNITIPDGVTIIGERAFYHCSGLTSITIPESVNSIGESAFYDCSGLTSITIPDGVTIIGERAFYNCIGLTSITIPESVNSIGERAFEGCSGLTSITIPNGVTSIGNGAFFRCIRLTSITIPNGVTSIGTGAFNGCIRLTSITIPESVNSIGERAFEGCSGLTSITIPESVTSIGDSAFLDCSGLTSITIPKNVTCIEARVFSGCYGIESIGVETGNPIYDSREDCNAIIESANNILIAGCKNTQIPDGVVVIDAYAFHDCMGLKHITLPQSVAYIGAYAFSGCESLRYVTIPKGVVRIDKTAFKNCPASQYLTIPDGCTYGDDTSNRPESSPNASSVPEVKVCFPSPANDDKPNYGFIMDIGTSLTGISSFLLNLYLFVPVFVKKLGVQFTLKEQIYMSKETESVSIPSSQWCMMVLALGLAITSIILYIGCRENKVSDIGPVFAMMGLIMGAIFIVLAANSLLIPVLDVFGVIIGLIVSLFFISAFILGVFIDK